MNDKEMIDEFAAEVRKEMAHKIRAAVEERKRIIEGVYDKQFEQRFYRKEEINILMSIVNDVLGQE